MSRRTIAFVLLAILAAVAFARLGFWQLSRLAERRARNASIATRLESEAVPFWSLPRDSAAIHFRRATLVGTPDFANEFYHTNRSRLGAPGVHVLTPVRVSGQDTAVLVNRGWVYAPDGSVIEPSRWRAPDTTFVGYVEEFTSGLPDQAATGRRLRRVSHAAIAEGLPYPVASTYLVAIGSDSVILGVPLRAPALLLDEGPHRSYAIQWFAFALIALSGGALVLLKEREARRRWSRVQG